MFYPIVQRITTIIEEEATEGGLLSSLVKVYSGSYQVLPQAAYPAATLVFQESRIQGNPGRLEMEAHLSIGVFSIRPTQVESLEELSSLAWDSDSGSGFLPLLMRNRNIEADGVKYRLEPGTISITKGSDSSRRYVWAMEIPLRVKTWAQF